ncbi:[Fe-Fe] hydrogenase large subunit C-terminal domain-containing protein [Clostridium sp. ZS2-4]|uniref:[Fe-Fe] hydrogenase large subunit C-terminal domain-containing protein n=1 Tax=Clostridium sp. ZS2-4 TaxID=2987703 RepID=UPI00227AC28F|nr:[Fe-Fe] hydrogenase large subunit C-terminal domain-containing protein [Clostridium sp. ZS2-4]MCY6353746.1 4Fe-4S binding protein [Clostridium sp. ZS2-4]
MKYMNFSNASCKNCYKCLRSCPVKAIRFKNQQAEIVEERCIGCGHCLEVCPQNAREIVSDLEKVKNLIASEKNVIASIAPSFPGYFNIEEGKIVAVLKKLGFDFIEETAVGAEIVSNFYSEYVEKNKDTAYITTCCPSANYLVEKYFPELVPYMIPAVSPMIAHGQILKSIYGKESFVIFIGPCAAKKIEAGSVKNNKFIDAVLTFEEINQWILESKIDMEEIKREEINKCGEKRGHNYPVDGGIIEAVKDELEKKQLQGISVSGTEDCINILKSMKSGTLKSVFVEMSVCKGSCIGGSNMVNNQQDYYEKLQKVKKYIKKRENASKDKKFDKNTLKVLTSYINLNKSFRDKSIKIANVEEADIKRIMREMGKFEPKDELNCGVCGYNTCREKAKAIYQGMAETDMCLHFMRSKAERLTNVIFENTASSVILIDEELNVKEINPAAQEVFMVEAENIKGKPVAALINDEDFRKVKETGNSIIGKKVEYPQYNAVFIENIVYLPKQNLVLASMINIVEEEKNKEELIRVKENTLNAAEEVIEKQMRVAQEIAGLLGETTAETKVILNKLRKVVAGEDKH